MVVFDITNIGSFKAVANKWLPEIDSHIVSCHVIHVEELVS